MADFAETTSATIAPTRPRSASIESRGSWIAAGVSLALLSVSYGSPLLIVVGLKPIPEDLGTARQMVALAASARGTFGACVMGATLWVGLLGSGALYPPLLVYVSRWFDRRRGTALALISSGQYIAGMAWPILFERAMTDYGWRATMIGWAVIMLLAVPPIAWLFLHRPPEVPTSFFR